MPLKAALAGQFEILTREVARDDVPTDEEALDDLGRNAGLYIFHQDDADSQQVNDVRTGCQLQFNRVKMYIIFSRLF